MSRDTKTVSRFRIAIKTKQFAEYKVHMIITVILLLHNYYLAMTSFFLIIAQSFNNDIIINDIIFSIVCYTFICICNAQSYYNF
jgi:hypothetical protein